MIDLVLRREQERWPARHYRDAPDRCAVCRAAIIANTIGWQHVAPTLSIPLAARIVITCNAHYCRDRGAKGLVP